MARVSNIEFSNDLHELNFSSMDERRIQVKGSPEKERQISVDPTSLREPSFHFMLAPIITAPRETNTTGPLPPLIPPAKSKFGSLTNSATSSPRFGSFLSKKKGKTENQAPPKKVDNLVRQHSAVEPRLSSLKDDQFRRSKSCGEGRVSAPSDDFDLCLPKPNDAAENYSMQPDTNKDVHKTVKNNPDPEEFKCGALCLFLPCFGKGKQVRPRKEETVMENVISRTVSLEKFECGSWASSAIVDEDGGDSTNHYFDLPLELIRSSVNDAHSPINAAFVFDKDRKGVLKNGSTRVTARKSHESSRHVRFSESSPSCPESPGSCVTPRLRKAREDFNAFLEAQSA